MIGLTPTQERIMAHLQAGELTALQLQYVLWKDGGPEWPASTLKAHICYLNKRLRPWGTEVRCRRGYRTAGVYYLHQIRLSDVPVHKQFDPEGLYIAA